MGSRADVHYLSFDADEELLRDLLEVERQLQRAREDKYALKYALAALQGVIHDISIVVLSKGSHSPAYRNAEAREAWIADYLRTREQAKVTFKDDPAGFQAWWERYGLDHPFPEANVLPTKQLYLDSRRKVGIPVGTVTDQAVDDLITARDDFTHLRPGATLLSVLHIFTIIGNILPFLEHVLGDSHHLMLDSEPEAEALRCIERIVQHVAELRVQYRNP